MNDNLKGTSFLGKQLIDTTQEIPHDNTTTGFSGFSTGSGKKVSVSAGSLKRIHEMFGDFDDSVHGKENDDQDDNRVDDDIQFMIDSSKPFTPLKPFIKSKRSDTKNVSFTPLQPNSKISVDRNTLNSLFTTPFKILEPKFKNQSATPVNTENEMIKTITKESKEQMNEKFEFPGFSMPSSLSQNVGLKHVLSLKETPMKSLNSFCTPQKRVFRPLVPDSINKSVFEVPLRSGLMRQSHPLSKCYTPLRGTPFKPFKIPVTPLTPRFQSLPKSVVKEIKEIESSNYSYTFTIK